MTPAQQQNAAKEFIQRWTGNGYEKGDTQKFWLELLQKVFGISDPYVYAANNPVCNVDWMGLSPWGFSCGTYNNPINYVVINDEGIVVDVVINGDFQIYLAEDGWEKGDDISSLEVVGLMCETYQYYRESMTLGTPAKGLYLKNFSNAEFFFTISLGVQMALNEKGGIYINLASYEFLNYHNTLRFDTPLSKGFQNQRISQGVGIGLFLLEKSFEISSERNYIYGTDNTEFSIGKSLFEDLFKFMGFSTDGKSLTFNVGAAFGLGVNFSFNVSLYY